MSYQRYRPSPPTYTWLVNKLNERFGYSLVWPYTQSPGQPAGQTTSMLILALSAMHHGKHIVIFAHTAPYANELARKLFLWAWNTGLGQRKDIFPRVPEEYGDRFYVPGIGKNRDYLICIDHSCNQYLPSSAFPSIFTSPKPVTFAP